MPGQAVRKKSVRQKLNPINLEFLDKVVLLVDDSIVRGTTCSEIIRMAREAGAKKVYFASAAPPVRYPNVYGIDMPQHPSSSRMAVRFRKSRERSAPTGSSTKTLKTSELQLKAAKPTSRRSKIRFSQGSIYMKASTPTTSPPSVDTLGHRSYSSGRGCQRDRRELTR